MKKFRVFATHMGVAIGVVYLFFLIPPIEALFPTKFMLSLRQTLAVSFAICLLFNYEGIIRSGEKIVPKLMAILDIITGRRTNNGA